MSRIPNFADTPWNAVRPVAAGVPAWTEAAAQLAGRAPAERG